MYYKNRAKMKKKRLCNFFLKNFFGQNIAIVIEMKYLFLYGYL